MLLSWDASALDASVVWFSLDLLSGISSAIGCLVSIFGFSLAVVNVLFILRLGAMVVIFFDFGGNLAGLTFALTAIFSCSEQEKEK